MLSSINFLPKKGLSGASLRHITAGNKSGGSFSTRLSKKLLPRNLSNAAALQGLLNVQQIHCKIRTFYNDVLITSDLICPPCVLYLRMIVLYQLPAVKVMTHTLLEMLGVSDTEDY